MNGAQYPADVRCRRTQDALCRARPVWLDVLDIGETLASQQLLGDLLRRPDRRQRILDNLSRVVSGGGSAASDPDVIQESSGSGERRRAQKFSSAPAHSIVSIVLDSPIEPKLIRGISPRVTSRCSGLRSIVSSDCSCLQLLLQLFQKPPVRSLGDDLLRARLDHAGLVQTERPEPDGVFGDRTRASVP